MKKVRVLKNILKRTQADKILYSYAFFLLGAAAILTVCETEIHTYGDALWYCFAVISTVGFGDMVASTFLGRLISVLLSVYSIFVVAIITGVVVNFYTQLIQIQQENTLSAFIEKLEHLPDLSPEELQVLSEKVKNFHVKKIRKMQKPETQLDFRFLYLL